MKKHTNTLNNGSVLTFSDSIVLRGVMNSELLVCAGLFEIQNKLLP
jgi:hypothetical protein